MSPRHAQVPLDPGVLLGPAHLGSQVGGAGQDRCPLWLIPHLGWAWSLQQAQLGLMGKVGMDVALCLFSFLSTSDFPLNPGFLLTQVACSPNLGPHTVAI